MNGKTSADSCMLKWFRVALIAAVWPMLHIKASSVAGFQSASRISAREIFSRCPRCLLGGTSTSCRHCSKAQTTTERVGIGMHGTSSTGQYRQSWHTMRTCDHFACNALEYFNTQSSNPQCSPSLGSGTTSAANAHSSGLIGTRFDTVPTVLARK